MSEQFSGTKEVSEKLAFNLEDLNIYLEKKQYERASNVIDEIKWSYPNSYWINNVELLLEKHSLGGMI